MPTYLYRCKSCSKEFEEFQKFADEPLLECPSCKQKTLVRVIGGSGLVFKGSGFYQTDYKNQSTGDTVVKSPSKKEEKTESKQESKSIESKEETRSTESKEEAKPTKAKEETKPAESKSKKGGGDSSSAE